MMAEGEVIAFPEVGGSAAGSLFLYRGAINGQMARQQGQRSLWLAYARGLIAREKFRVRSQPRDRLSNGLA